MNALAMLICVGAAAAQGQGATAEDRRILADLGLQAVGGDLVSAGSRDGAARPGRRGVRQGGPVCRWVLLDMGDWTPFGGQAFTPVLDSYGAPGAFAPFGGYGGPAGYRQAATDALTGQDGGSIFNPALPGETIPPQVLPPPPPGGTAVAEPATLAILSLPGIALGFIVRRRKKVH